MTHFFKYFKSKKYMYMFICILFISGLICGILLGLNHHDLLEPSIRVYASNIKGIPLMLPFIHLVFLLAILFSSFFLIGPILYILLFFFEGVLYGYFLSAFTSFFGISGFLFSLLFLLFSHFLFLFGMIILFPKCIEITKSVISKLLYKKDNDLFLFQKIKTSFILLFLLFILELFLLFISSYLLKLFQFLLT